MKTELETIRDERDAALVREKLFLRVICDLVQLGRDFEAHKIHGYRDRVITMPEARLLTDRAAELNARSASIQSRMEVIAEGKFQAAEALARTK